MEHTAQVICTAGPVSIELHSAACIVQLNPSHLQGSPVITSQITYPHWNPGLRVCLWGTQIKTGYLPVNSRALKKSTTSLFPGGVVGLWDQILKGRGEKGARLGADASCIQNPWNMLHPIQNVMCGHLQKWGRSQYIDMNPYLRHIA